MIFLNVAMQCEAKPLISFLQLKKDNEAKNFQVYKSDRAVLVVSGTGAMHSAIASTYMLAKCNAKKSDLFANIGICGTKNSSFEIGTVVICSKIIDNNTKKELYPDMLFRHTFREGTIETFAKVVDSQNMHGVEGEFVDMEAAGAFQAAKTFLPLHRIFCIKVISDYMHSTQSLTAADVTKLIERNTPNIINWLKNIQDNMPDETEIFSSVEQCLLKQINQNLKLTATMGFELVKMSKNLKTSGGDLVEILRKLSSLKYSTKNEVKKHFAELRKKLTEF